MTDAASKPARLTTRAEGLPLSTGAMIRAGLLALAFTFLFYRWLWVQHRHSQAALSDWGHAYIMPLIGGYLIWQARDRIQREIPTIFWPGLLPLLMGVLCYFYFIVGISNHMLQGLSMILALAGLSLFLTGPRIFRFLFLPISLLVFSVTISKQIMEKITFPLQLLASKGAGFLLRLFSMGGDWYFADVQGNTIHIRYAGRDIPLNVAEACSGLRMLIAFFALAAIVSVLSCRHWWQRIALMLLAAPVALLMNTLRVAVLGWLSLIDSGLAAGDAHMLIGTLLLIPSLGLFLGVVWALNKIVSDQPARAAA